MALREIDLFPVRLPSGFNRVAERIALTVQDVSAFVDDRFGRTAETLGLALQVVFAFIGFSQQQIARFLALPGGKQQAHANANSQTQQETSEFVHVFIPLFWRVKVPT